MAFKTFSDGAVLTETDLNTYLMKQANIACTSGTRPSSTAETMQIAETDTDRIYHHNGTTWVWTGAYNNANSTATMDAAFTATRNQVYRRGVWGWFALTCNRPGGSLAAGVGVTAATLPVGYWPAVTFDTTAVTSSGITCTVTVDATNGQIGVRPSALVAAATSIAFSPVAYPLAA